MFPILGPFVGVIGVPHGPRRHPRMDAHASVRSHVIMYRNFHGSGEVDAEFDDICEGAKTPQYRITVNSTKKRLQGGRLL